MHTHAQALGVATLPITASHASFFPTRKATTCLLRLFPHSRRHPKTFSRRTGAEEGHPILYTAHSAHTISVNYLTRDFTLCVSIFSEVPVRGLFA